MISKVTGSTVVTEAIDGILLSSVSHTAEEPGSIASAGARDERSDELDRHVRERLVRRFAFLDGRLRGRAAVGLREAHLAEVLDPGRDHLRKADADVGKARHRLTVDELR